MSNIGFVSTRFEGTDGVSLESEKWAKVLLEDGHSVFWFGGKLDRGPAVSMLVPEAFFEHPSNVAIANSVWGKLHRPTETTDAIHALARSLRTKLYEFRKRFEVDFLVVENALTIPMHISLGVALTEFLSETAMPAIAHHHDFYWERTRFAVGAVRDYLGMAFPPNLLNVQHAVINSAAKEELAWRKGLASLVVPNVIDFERPPGPPEHHLAKIRETIGLSRGDILILQPTRVVPRKGIEQAIILVSRLKDLPGKLVISHESGDEGDAYLRALLDMAADEEVDLRFVRCRIPSIREQGRDSQKDDRLSLWDVYRCADLVTYPSLYEGFGNALLEAFYFRVPVVVNRYSIWIQDIEPKGFRTLSMDGFVTRELVAQVRSVLEDKEARDRMVEHNHTLASRYFSYAVLRRRLRTLIANVLGAD